jgi:outer membrane protein OmpA-like peptidoglycan-associated protein
MISWDGRAEDGRHVEGGEPYRYRMEVSYADNSVSTSGLRIFAVNRVSAISLNLTGSAFESNSAVLSEKARKALKETASILGKHPEEKITVEGHTDGIGTEKHNMDLSRRRAASAVDYLVKECGIPVDRFLVHWYGKSRPVAGNDTPVGRELNRRVELKGEFQETKRAAVYDQYRTMPVVRINSVSLDVDPLGRFRTSLPAETERIDVEMVTSEGRSVRTSLALPGTRIENPSGTFRLPPGATADGHRFFPIPGDGSLRDGDPAGTYRIAGWTEPGNTVALYGKPVRTGPAGDFSDTLDVRRGGNLFGFEVRNPEGLTRILHLDLDVSREPGKEDVGQ